MNWQFLNNHLEQLSQRDRRALKIAVLAVGAILIFSLVLSPWLDHWGQVRAQLKDEKAKVAKLESAHRQAAVALVPVLEPPQSSYRQRLIFERKISEQLKKAGIGVKKSLQYSGKGKKDTTLNCTVLQLTCQGTAKFDQVLTLLAGLNENPYLLGVEQLDLQCGPENKRQELTLSLTLATPAANK